jgi:ParB family chromosome partitioning protein
VVKQLRLAAEEPKVKPARKVDEVIYRRSAGEKGVTARKRGRKFQLEFEDSLSESSLRGALDAFLKDRFGK